MEGDDDDDEGRIYRFDAEAVARGPKLSFDCTNFFSGPVLVVSSRGRFGVRGMVPILYAVTTELKLGSSIRSLWTDGFGRE